LNAGKGWQAFLTFFESRIAEGGSAPAEDLTADYARMTKVRCPRMIRMDAKILSKENHLHSAHQTFGCGDAIVFSRLRPDYGAPRKKPIHLWLSAREALPKIDPRKRSWDKAPMRSFGPTTIRINAGLFHGSALF